MFCWNYGRDRLRLSANHSSSGAVINMSIGGGVLANLLMLWSAVEAGVHVVVSAGNSNRDACLQSSSLGG
jgi:subtilisin family serine protease